MKKTTETPVQMRFGDVDIFGHVNNVRQQEYLDVGKIDFCRRVVGTGGLSDDPTLMIVSTKSDFLDELRSDDEAVVHTWVERIGTKSVTLGQQIVCPAAGVVPKICTESSSVLVAFDRRTRQTIEIPSEWRRAMEQ